jgi:hypothetical protein
MATPTAALVDAVAARNTVYMVSGVFSSSRLAIAAQVWSVRLGA